MSRDIDYRFRCPKILSDKETKVWERYAIMDEDEIIEQASEARDILMELRDECEIPSIAHSAHQADVYCHGILWELGAEDAFTPELSPDNQEEE
jgi:hypothetical protein